MFRGSSAILILIQFSRTTHRRDKALTSSVQYGNINGHVMWKYARKISNTYINSMARKLPIQKCCSIEIARGK